MKINLKTLLPQNTIYKYSIIEDRNWNAGMGKPVTTCNYK